MTTETTILENPGERELSGRQLKRAAGPTIAGYVYQFERTIVELLDGGPRASVRVEGIEDIDIWGEGNNSAIQVKYLKASKYTSPKSVREPILEMLRSFAGGHRVGYILYVYFGTGCPPESFSIEDLKLCLTMNPKIGEQVCYYNEFEQIVLDEFVLNLKIVAGREIEVQRKDIIGRIATILGCSSEDAEVLYHPMAVQLIQSKSTMASDVDRILSYADFIAKLNVRESLYGRWHSEFIGLERYTDLVVKRMKSENFAKPTDNRALVVQVCEDTVQQAIGLGVYLAQDYSGKKRTTIARPWTLVLRGSNSLVDKVKAGLIDRSIEYKDGYESISFSPALFSLPPIVNTNGKGQIIVKSSHSVKVIREDTMRMICQAEHQFTRILVTVAPEEWHKSVSKSQPMVVHGFSLQQVYNIIGRII